MHTDLKKLRNVVCPCCDGQFKLVPDSFTDEKLQAMADQVADRTGNITVCHHCGLPLQFVPAISDQWQPLNKRTAEKIPLEALMSLIECIVDITKEKHLTHTLMPIAMLGQLLIERIASNEAGGVKTSMMQVKREDSKPEDLSRN